MPIPDVAERYAHKPEIPSVTKRMGITTAVILVLIFITIIVIYRQLLINFFIIYMILLTNYSILIVTTVFSMK